MFANIQQLVTGFQAILINYIKPLHIKGEHGGTKTTPDDIVETTHILHLPGEIEKPITHYSSMKNGSPPNLQQPDAD